MKIQVNCGYFNFIRPPYGAWPVLEIKFAPERVFAERA